MPLLVEALHLLAILLGNDGGALWVRWGRLDGGMREDWSCNEKSERRALSNQHSAVSQCGFCGSNGGQRTTLNGSTQEVSGVSAALLKAQSQPALAGLLSAI
jgi:hypothetical protein